MNTAPRVYAATACATAAMLILSACGARHTTSSGSIDPSLGHAICRGIVPSGRDGDDNVRDAVTSTALMLQTSYFHNSTAATRAISVAVARFCPQYLPSVRRVLRTADH